MSVITSACSKTFLATVSALVMIAGMVVALAPAAQANPAGVTWTSQTSAANNSWRSVTYGNGLFVAVSGSGTNNRVMTSSDGITWTSQTSAADNDWQSVTYGNELFVAVSSFGAGDRVMTSSDGITWVSRTAAADNYWLSVTYGNGLFVAVSYSGAENRVMTSGVFGGAPSIELAQWTSYYQALPMPDSGFCQNITTEQNAFAAYGTGVSGGWVKSWEPWVANGVGGWGCQRNLVNTGGNNWVVTGG